MDRNVYRSLNEGEKVFLRTFEDISRVVEQVGGSIDGHEIEPDEFIGIDADVYGHTVRMYSTSDETKNPQKHCYIEYDSERYWVYRFMLEDPTPTWASDIGSVRFDIF